MNELDHIKKNAGLNEWDLEGDSFNIDVTDNIIPIIEDDINEALRAHGIQIRWQWDAGHKHIACDIVSAN